MHIYVIEDMNMQCQRLTCSCRLNLYSESSAKADDLGGQFCQISYIKYNK